VTRRVELRPSAEKDLIRLAKFVAKFSAPAGERRAKAIDTFLASLGAEPFKGAPRGANAAFRQAVFRVGKATYVVRYRVTPKAVVITRIWHGRQNRPPR
jgi:plasmid stabilization system protein ParE